MLLTKNLVWSKQNRFYIVQQNWKPFLRCVFNIQSSICDERITTTETVVGSFFAKKTQSLIFDGILNLTLKLLCSIFHFFHQMIALKYLRKMLFISSEMLFSFSRYSDFCISVFPYFFPLAVTLIGHYFITHFVWYLAKEKRFDIETLLIHRVLKKEHFYGKVMQKICTKC